MSDPLDDLFTLPATAVATVDESPPPPPAAESKPATASRPRSRSSAKGGTLYFDFETVPDMDRFPDLCVPDAGLGPVPDPREETPVAKCPSPVDFLKGTIPDIERAINGVWPEDDYLVHLTTTEKNSPKPRKGVLDLIDGVFAEKQKQLNAKAERVKLLSTTPEYCKIVAIGVGMDDGPISAWLDGEVDNEAEMLTRLWSMIKQAKRVCGFNIVNFDLPVLFVRSMLLDIPATKRIDTKPWGDDVLDLYAVRYPKGATGEDKTGRPSRLKTLAKVLGIPVPAGDTDGSDVYRLWQEEPAKLAEYVSSDVELCRQMHRRYAGYFCL